MQALQGPSAVRPAARPARRSGFAGSVMGLEAPLRAAAAAPLRLVTVSKASPVAASYAVALAEAAQGAGALEAVHADAETFAAYSLANAGIASVLANPVLSDAKKKDLVAQLAKEGSFTPLFLSFLNLLINKRRVGLVAQVLAEFETIYCKLTDTQIATVTSAVKLEAAQQFAIAEKLQAMTGAKNIKLNPVVDPSLLGGFVVQYGKDGSGMIDLSIKGQMAGIAASLAA